MNNDVNIEVETSSKEEDEITEVLLDQRKKVDENEIRISACRRCGRYPRVVFEDTRNCVSGHCFRKYIKELIDGTEQLPD